MIPVVQDPLVIQKEPDLAVFGLWYDSVEKLSSSS